MAMYALKKPTAFNPFKGANQKIKQKSAPIPALILNSILSTDSDALDAKNSVTAVMPEKIASNPVKTARYASSVVGVKIIVNNTTKAAIALG